MPARWGRWWWTRAEACGGNHGLGQIARPCENAGPASRLGRYGEMAERFKAPVLKTGEGLNLPWVRIPLSPPILSKCLFLNDIF